MKHSPDYSKANDKATEMTSMSTITLQAVKDGYTENYKVDKLGLCGAADHHYKADEVEVINFYRFEGDSDPGDNTILYLIQTFDGHKGTLVDGLGAYANPAVAAFMQQVKGVNKVVQ